MSGSNKKEKYSTAAKEILARYKAKARERSFDFNLTAAQFTSLLQKNCAYCGRSARKSKSVARASKQGPTPFNGVDRVDSSQGYEIWNVVTCCVDCNRAKSAMSVREFEFWIRRVYARLQRKIRGKK